MPRTILFLMLVLTSCSAFEPSAGKVGARIGEAIREMKAQEVDIASMTDFAWDELFLFGPYEDRSNICASLGLHGAECDHTAPEYIDEGAFLMVFRLDGKIIHVENHRRYFGDFSRSGVPQPILRSAAKFSSRQGDTTTDGRPWYYLEFHK